ncbi:hypothetical protein [Kingella oralis]|uniref:hypothetical protein n=1 Tax=Kingella oralis TaxID=505 RepID=UPI0002EB3BD5|nr:hypothetical protein [Kingella oralis]QMT42627.1 hypothetical protein H3L93_11805 [Kingella oralis]
MKARRTGIITNTGSGIETKGRRLGKAVCSIKGSLKAYNGFQAAFCVGEWVCNPHWRAKRGKGFRRPFSGFRLPRPHTG